jgi:hypothetical protein
MRSRNQLPCVNQEAPNMRVWMQQGAPDILIRHTWNCINLGVFVTFGGTWMQQGAPNMRVCFTTVHASFTSIRASGWIWMS